MILPQIFDLREPKPNYKILNSISKRFSPRVFNTEDVPNEDLAKIFEAARWAPSGRNHQPWFYVWARRGTEGYKKLISCLPERNAWAMGAPILILSSYNPEEPNDIVNKWAQFDLGAANLSLILQAQELGYYSRQIGSFDAEKAKEVVPVEDPYIPFVIIALGKIGTEEDYAKADSSIIEKEIQPNTRREKIAKELS